MLYAVLICFKALLVKKKTKKTSKFAQMSFLSRKDTSKYQDLIN